ncbi:phosphate ABC transporter substrate-binding protein PstS [Pseudomonas sp. v388]|uniref:phosphate ABC transporter substrate-binding protein PstS n=1 Tax=Pseudomonas sp. v388 TaxID=2479849 RepID=UPI000F770CE2|nr:phosphate ABC transporter substrate-binding protein PstS [Pseudomonas sp. v388]RRV10223.1 phosphate ABC transporter substrate-binding protein PstS [Pseudomonas sp. v388]
MDLFCAQPVTRRRLLQLAGVGLLGGFALSRAVAQDAFGQALLRGAGSTFVLPLVEQWLRLYRGGTSGVAFQAGNAGLDDDALGRAALDYEAIGSQAGLLRLQAKAVDFAFSELPLSAAELTRLELIQMPVVVGGVAIATHLPRFKDNLRLDGPTLAAILRGDIVRWNHASIAALNPNVALPDQTIMPIHRADGSGTTHTLTRYLATQDPEWPVAIGVDAVVRWPVGKAVRGSGAMAQTLASTPGSIGYLDAVQAQAAGLGIVQLKNGTGHFVKPDPGSIEAAIQAVPWQAGQDAQPQFINAPGAASYPVVATVLAVLNRRAISRQDRRARAFLAWALTNGQHSARDLGYVPLPASLAQQVRELLVTSVQSPRSP